MALFLWEATTRKNEVKKGEMEAADDNAVRNALRRQGFKSITVKKKPKELSEYFPFLKGGVKDRRSVV
jgi:type IV pilus assembly protein PilC